MLLLLLLAAFPGALVSAAAPTSETITLVRDGGDSHELGWAASGTFADGCQPLSPTTVCWTTDRRVFSGGPRFVVGQVLTTMTGANGSFGLRFEGQDRHDGTFAGDWEIIAGSGTRAYARLSGHGKWTWAQDPGTGNGVFTLLGQVQLR
jgi:hypothetical protein